MAGCAVTPYESSGAENVLPLRALFFEWMPDYALLGVRAIVYDAPALALSPLAAHTAGERARTTSRRS